jgi:DNA-directed DNA polymerase III PolC
LWKRNRKLMNYISPCNHPESPLSGSTVESMIDKTKELGLEYFAVTDVGNLSSIVRAYTYGEKKGVKVIPGIEIVFKDSDCPIIEETESAQIKYFKFIVHAQDQEAFQKLVKMSSDQHRRMVEVGEHEYRTFNWKDLEEISKYNVTVTNSNVEDLITKHLIVDRMDIALKYYQKVKEIFGKKYYPSIVPYKYDKYWQSMVEVTLGDDDHVIHIPANDRIETDHYKKALAKELPRRGNRHKMLEYIYINKIRYPVKYHLQEIKKARLLNEFQPLPSGDIQTKANKFILAVAKREGDLDRVLINNYSYYATEGDQVVQSMKLGEDKRIEQKQHMRSLKESEDYLYGELGLSHIEIANFVKNSQDWAKHFDEFNLKYEYRLPKPDGDPKEELMRIINEVGRMDWDNPVYVKQFEEELALLTDNGTIDLVPYFLPIVDIYKSYKDNGYLTGPARGSAGGFLISYLIGITHIDPIKYELSTSRFLTIDRVQQGNLPDIDCDLESRQHLVGKDGNGGYLFNRYGDCAAQISTRTLLRIKSAILDANRFVNKGKLEQEVQALSKSLPNTPQGVSDQDFVFGYENGDGSHEPGLIELNEDLQKYAAERPEEWNIVTRALSLARQNSRHACAYVVSDRPIEEDVPIFEVGGVKRVTQYEHKHCEWAGLIKYDFLVVDAVKKARVCLDYINKKNGDTDMETGFFMENGKKTFVWDLPVDMDVFKMLWSGKTETVFQLHSSTATPLVMDIKPESVVDCAVITSLGRPGPLDFKDESTGRNMAEEYGYRKRGQSKSNLAIMDEMLPETYGVLVFQEQVTKLAKELAGMNVIDAENVRIAVGKKKKKLIDSLKPIFIEGASKKIPHNEAVQVWDMMETFARYGFNKSHAVAYSVISYACAYFKHHYPLEWWAAVISTSDTKKINEEYYQYIKDMVLPPDINVSTEEISIDYSEKKIRSKLSMISGLGKKVANKIMDGRPYANLEDFISKKVCGAALTRKLIHVGVLDSFFAEGDSLMAKMQKFEDTCNKVAFDNKLVEYQEKIDNAEDDKTRERTIKNMERYKAKGPKAGKVDPKYIMITPQNDYLMKKDIFPTMNLDLNKVLRKESKMKVLPSHPYDRVFDEWGRETPLVSGEHLQRVDNMELAEDQEVVLACPAYVIDADEFTYAGGEKKALKLILDSSGYISEKVLWADYETGVLEYPKSLKKGAIVYVYYKRKLSKSKNICYTNISNIIVESEPI